MKTSLNRFTSRLYTITGSPIALARPRFSKDSGNVWDSQKVLKHALIVDLEDQHAAAPLFTGALHLSVCFYMPLPKQMCYEKKLIRVKEHHVTRPDLSNMLKFIEDCAQGILFANDSAIVSTDALKCYSFEPRTEFTIIELGTHE